MKLIGWFNNTRVVTCMIAVGALSLIWLKVVSRIDSADREFIEASKAAANSYVSNKLEGNWTLISSKEEDQRVFHTFSQIPVGNSPKSPGSFITVIMAKNHEVIRVSGGL